MCKYDLKHQSENALERIHRALQSKDPSARQVRLSQEEFVAAKSEIDRQIVQKGCIVLMRFRMVRGEGTTHFRAQEPNRIEHAKALAEPRLIGATLMQHDFIFTQGIFRSYFKRRKIAKNYRVLLNNIGACILYLPFEQEDAAKQRADIRATAARLGYTLVISVLHPDEKEPTKVESEARTLSHLENSAATSAK